MAEERVQRRLAAIFAADMVAYSRLMEADETGTIARQKAHRAELVDPQIASHGGRIVKTTGDGMLVEFGSVVDATQCAVAIQRAMAEREADVGEEHRIQYRIGINLGDIVIDGDDILGDGVNVAARLEGLAEPGGVYISDVVHQSVAGKLDVAFEDLGEQQVKNISKPVHAYRVMLDGAPAAPSAAPLALPDKPSIAVLPFDNLSGDPEQEYFTDGITEDIITSLSHLRQLYVTARNSTFSYKGQAMDVQLVASELGVRYVLEGSVRKSNNQVRITTQLIDGETGNHLWAERYDRALADIFAVQDEITQTVVGALQPELTRSEVERARRKPPESLDAWDLYQRGLWHYFRLNKEDNAAAIELFSKAIELDPDFVPPYVGLAESNAYDVMFGFSEWNAEALFAPARKAVEIDPEDESAHRALGRAHYMNRDHTSAIAEYKMAIQLNPSAAHSYNYLGFAQAHSGLAEEALENFRLARRLSPRDPHFGYFQTGMGASLFYLQRYEESVDWVRKALQYPNVAWVIRLFLVSALAHLDRIEESRKALADLLEIQPGCTISLAELKIPITDDASRDLLVEGLRNAGLPES
jgi:TolB-like protein/Tfp pilus assembly protein PilF